MRSYIYPDAGACQTFGIGIDICQPSTGHLLEVLIVPSVGEKRFLYGYGATAGRFPSRRLSFFLRLCLRSGVPRCSNKRCRCAKPTGARRPGTRRTSCGGRSVATEVPGAVICADAAPIVKAPKKATNSPHPDSEPSQSERPLQEPSGTGGVQQAPSRTMPMTSSSRSSNKTPPLPPVSLGKSRIPDTPSYLETATAATARSSRRLRGISPEYGPLSQDEMAT
ncbi:hypothetical protein HPB51_016572 [Rhipicephalus microplus]|uniref:Uncharacterized protein n=1 Tax=Rhipicephalus microplus TaxID=6941 RepID=A0A9J6EAR5_RHIMP|nr:hypothetical protein HPB51_016572 [Rhipicephalus microplus]